MEVDAIAAAATAMKMVQAKFEANATVMKKTMDVAKSDAELVLQLMEKAMGIGQNVNLTA